MDQKIDQKIEEEKMEEKESFETLSGTALVKMEPHEIHALSKDELLCLVFHSKAIVTATRRSTHV